MWHLVDASAAPLGRLATRISTILQGGDHLKLNPIPFVGKHKPIYHPSTDCGDHVIVVNAKNLFLTGNKAKEGVYRWHTGYRGGLKERRMPEMLARDPTQVLTACMHLLGDVEGSQGDAAEEQIEGIEDEPIEDISGRGPSIPGQLDEGLHRNDSKGRINVTIVLCTPFQSI